MRGLNHWGIETFVIEALDLAEAVPARLALQLLCQRCCCQVEEQTYDYERQEGLHQSIFAKSIFQPQN